MGYCKDPFHMNRQAKKGMKHMESIFKFGVGIAAAAAKEAKAQQRAYAKQEAAYQRYLLQEERNRIREIKQNEAYERRMERERAKAERERQKAAILQSKQQEQERLELEISSIEDENELWTNLHSYCNSIITINDINSALEKCKQERENLKSKGLFKTEYPKKLDSEIIAQKEADAKYDLKSLERLVKESKERLGCITFTATEPTLDSIRQELTEQAKSTIKSFWPWKQNRLRNEFVNSQIDSVYTERHNSWKTEEKEYLDSIKEAAEVLKKFECELSEKLQAKKDFVQNRTKELFDSEIESWTEERNNFFDLYQKNLQNAIDGDKEYIINAINASFALDPDELPIEYFVDVAYDEVNERLLVDLDLPEIEDIPERKIVITPTGKKSIRQKSQTDLRSDYAHCVFGLGIYVADMIFNTSLKIKDVEISAFTQRKDNNSAVPTDQYVYLVNFSRDLFSRIDFSRLSSVQIMDFFCHHFNMTKGFDLKQIDLSTAYSKMETFVTADYDEYIKKLPKKESIITQTNITEKNKSATSSPTSTIKNDEPVVTFSKAKQFLSNIYEFIDKLSKDAGLNKHANNLDGVRITWTSGNMKGDADTNTYRGRLFFCVAVDLYRSLTSMRINKSILTPSVYSFAVYGMKIYGNVDLQYYTLSRYENVYHSLYEMFDPMASKVPTFEKYFMLSEVIGDYEKDLSWHNQYIQLMEEYINIIRDAVINDKTLVTNIDSFITKLNQQGLKISAHTR